MEIQRTHHPTTKNQNAKERNCQQNWVPIAEQSLSSETMFTHCKDALTLSWRAYACTLLFKSMVSVENRPIVSMEQSRPGVQHIATHLPQAELQAAPIQHLASLMLSASML